MQDRLALFSVLTVALPLPLMAQWPASCRPEVENRQVGERIDLPVGSYELILVAIAGSAAGAEARGTLSLRPGPGDPTVATWGAVEIDFDAVGAPVEAEPQYLPPPTSTDPARPGIIIASSQPTSANQVADVRLLIGTVRGGLDGEGIALHVRNTSASGFSGTWREHGIVYDGSGYFCAVWQ